MQDTTPEFQRLVAERFARMAPEERVRLCMEMFETARQLIEASLPPGLDRGERRWRVAERLYGELGRRAYAAVGSPGGSSVSRPGPTTSSG